MKSCSAHEGEGRGSRTRGWSLREPVRGTDRHNLMAKCGQKCFLGENESFPICPSLSVYEPGAEDQCQIDCTGIESAYIRAQEWKYPEVAKLAKQLLNTRCKK